MKYKIFNGRKVFHIYSNQSKYLINSAPNLIKFPLNENIKKLINLSKFTLKYHKGPNHKKALGLAANQIGSYYRFFIIANVNNIDKLYNNLKTIINPEIINYSEEKIISTEGCLSFPQYYFEVERSKEITVKYFNYEGNEIIRDLKGRENFCFQHEIDHLNGKLISDIGKIKSINENFTKFWKKEKLKIKLKIK